MNVDKGGAMRGLILAAVLLTVTWSGGFSQELEAGQQPAQSDAVDYEARIAELQERVANLRKRKADLAAEIAAVRAEIETTERAINSRYVSPRPKTAGLYDGLSLFYRPEKS